jgi:phosphatidylglycerol:prolipoprotein diacylglycerol transferase
MPLKLWWALAAVAALAALYGAFAYKRGEKTSAQVALGLAVLAGIGGYVYRAKAWEAVHLPIYSYGVMLGLSLVVGWYLTLGLADRDGLPKETMANCYVITAVVALIGSRLLYVVTNPDQFNSLADVISIRKGGYVAYGGFLGGFLGSWLYLRSQSLKLLPWADVAIPSLASGLLITRIGCYLYGCDFGRRLPESAPGWLKKAGTFPHWTGKALDAGDGSPAFVRHRSLFEGSPVGSELIKQNHSFPVHPTQIYEAIVGILLLGLLFWQRKNKRFDGQVFYLGVFAYGAIRFLLEILRDDPERNDWGPAVGQHLLIPVCLIALAVAFAFSFSLGVKDMRARTISRVVAFLPAVVAYVLLAPAKFGEVTVTKLSTSQVIGLLTGLLSAYFYAKGWVEASKPVKKSAKAKKAAAIVREVEEEEAEEEGEVENDEAESMTKATTAKAKASASSTGDTKADADKPKKSKKGELKGASEKGASEKAETKSTSSDGAQTAEKTEAGERETEHTKDAPDDKDA